MDAVSIREKMKKYYRSNSYLYRYGSRIISPILLHSLRLFPRMHEADFRILKTLDLGTEPTVIDVGANYGQSISSIRFCRSDAKVFAFEPNPIAAHYLERWYASPRTSIFNVGLSAEPGSATLHVPYYLGIPFHQLASVTDPSKSDIAADLRRFGFTGATSSAIEIKSLSIVVSTLDSFDLQPNFIKIDAEGHESRIIAGAKRTIEAHRPVLMCEGGQGVAMQLSTLSYRIFHYQDSMLVEGESGSKYKNSFFIPEEHVAGIRFSANSG